jgi:hypothetical protein
MNEILSPNSDALWERIAPHLDAALGELTDVDRDALLLRYFQRKSTHEIALPLGVSDQGHEVGELAKRLFPGGIEIGDGSDDFDDVLAASKQAIKQRRPLYESAFSFDGGYARADILSPVAGGLWDLIEVKSTTSYAAVSGKVSIRILHGRVSISWSGKALSAHRQPSLADFGFGRGKIVMNSPKFD